MPHRRTIGAITIGQTPRPDLLAELGAAVGGHVHFIEAGALDQLPPDASAPSPTGSRVLLTRLRNGASVIIGEEALAPLLQAAADRLAGRVDLLVPLCTGSLPRLEASVPILYPDRVLLGTVRATRAGRIGVLTPIAEQIPWQEERWRAVVAHPIVEAAAPYDDGTALDDAALRLRDQEIELVVMDCIGYTRRMKAAVAERVGRPVVLAMGLAGRVAAELIQGA